MSRCYEKKPKFYLKMLIRIQCTTVKHYTDSDSRAVIKFNAISHIARKMGEYK